MKGGDRFEEGECEFELGGALCMRKKKGEGTDKESLRKTSTWSITINKTNKIR